MNGLILIIDDEPDLVEALEYALTQGHFQVRVASMGTDGLRQALAEPLPDLVLLDLMLPDVAGIEVCRQLRADLRTCDLPVIIMSARASEIDRVVGFEVGADDYIAKPFSIRELILRIRAVLRRRHAGVTDLPPIQIGRMRIDVDAHRVWVDGQERALTSLEFRLLWLLFVRRGRVQTREALLNEVWGVNSDVSVRSVDTHIQRLRKKLGEAGEYVQTLRSVGYRFIADPSEDRGAGGG